MRLLSLSLLIITTLTLTSCKKDYQFKMISPKSISIDKELKISFKEKNNYSADSIVIRLDHLIKSTKENEVTFNIKDEKLGKHTLEATIYFEGKKVKKTRDIYFLNNKSPKVYQYNIINTYPHDKQAYTQGLEFHDGHIYESTGSWGKSSLRKVELKTGKVIQKIDLDKRIFGEGLTKIDNKIFMLTWQKKIGFIFDAESFEKLGEFDYGNSTKGWGLTNDGKNLIKTDGTEKIWFLDIDTQKEKSYIEVYTNKRKVESLNEIEYINGKIYANIYLQNTIAIINPKNGAVEGVINLADLERRVKKEQNLKINDEVLNGIAYDSENNRIFVTGKNWGKLFEIEIIK